MYRNFVKNEMSTVNETILSHFICLVTIIRNTNDSLTRVIEDTEHNLKGDHACLAAEFSSHDEGEYKITKKVYCRWGKAPRELAKRLEFLLPLASSQHFTYCQKKVCVAIDSEQGFHSYKLMLS